MKPIKEVEQPENKMWAKEFPRVDGVYWLRFNESASSEDWVVELNMSRVRRVGAEGDIRNWTDIDGCEYLGPISPSDTEELLALREEVQRLKDLLRKSAPYVASAAEATRMMDGFEPEEHDEDHLLAGMLGAINDAALSEALLPEFIKRSRKALGKE